MDGQILLVGDVMSANFGGLVLRLHELPYVECGEIFGHQRFAFLEDAAGEDDFSHGVQGSQCKHIPDGIPVELEVADEGLSEGYHLLVAVQDGEVGGQQPVKLHAVDNRVHHRYVHVVDFQF